MDSSLVLLASFAPPVKIGCLVSTICPTMVHGSLEVRCHLLIICIAAFVVFCTLLISVVCQRTEKCLHKQQWTVKEWMVSVSTGSWAESWNAWVSSRICNEISCFFCYLSKIAMGDHDEFRTSFSWIHQLHYVGMSSVHRLALHLKFCCSQMTQPIFHWAPRNQGCCHSGRASDV